MLEQTPAVIEIFLRNKRIGELPFKKTETNHFKSESCPANKADPSVCLLLL